LSPMGMGFRDTVPCRLKKRVVRAHEAVQEVQLLTTKHGKDAVA